MIGKRLANAKAVATGRIDMHGGRHLTGDELLIVVQAVEWRHGAVVVSQSQEAAWGMLRHMLFVGVLIDEFPLGGLTQQIVERALVSGALLHRDDRIEQYLEVRCSVASGMGSNGRGQMTASREPHDAYVLRVDMPLLGIPTNQSDGLLSIPWGMRYFSTMRAMPWLVKKGAHSKPSCCMARC